jgi:hypothetical protein
MRAIVCGRESLACPSVGRLARDGWELPVIYAIRGNKVAQFFAHRASRQTVPGCACSELQTNLWRARLDGPAHLCVALGAQMFTVIASFRLKWTSGLMDAQSDVSFESLRN